MEERFKKDVEDFQNAESRIMGDFKGTKGEWRVGGSDDTTVLSDIEHNGMVAEVHTPDSHCNHLAYCHDGTHWGEDIDVAQANAQLIATAPKLLVELYQMTLLLKALPENDSEMRERIESAEKIINKALGL